MSLITYPDDLFHCMNPLILPCDTNIYYNGEHVGIGSILPIRENSGNILVKLWGNLKHKDFDYFYEMLNGIKIIRLKKRL